MSPRRGFARARPDGAPVALAGVTQGSGDAYVEAVGLFSPLVTCNVRAGEALRAAGVRGGLWTPFAEPLMRGLRDVRAPVAAD